jgi:hypothetical protein
VSSTLCERRPGCRRLGSPMASEDPRTRGSAQSTCLDHAQHAWFQLQWHGATLRSMGSGCDDDVGRCSARPRLSSQPAAQFKSLVSLSPGTYGLDATAVTCMRTPCRRARHARALKYHVCRLTARSPGWGYA